MGQLSVGPSHVPFSIVLVQFGFLHFDTILSGTESELSLVMGKLSMAPLMCPTIVLVHSGFLQFGSTLSGTELELSLVIGQLSMGPSHVSQNSFGTVWLSMVQF